LQTDLEIARRAKLRNVVDLAREKFRIPVDHLEPYGHYKAKLSPNALGPSPRDQEKGKLILVTAISPTPAGEGKTTTVVGLGDALNRLGKKALICLREPSLGPCFGMKGGAAGGGMAQVVPMEDINLHFTGDFHALGLAHNLLAAMLDNHIHQGNRLDVDLRRVTWNRVVDLNDRALRRIVLGLGGVGNSYPREGGFEIVAASEVMAILCLSRSLQELKQRLGNITVGYTHARKPIRAADLEAHGAMAVLLKEALKPNLVQTLENNLALVHGGPFANIAHGCNSVIATLTGLGLADYLVTEAGFGADLGAEKFVDIKCRKAGLRPDLVVRGQGQGLPVPVSERCGHRCPEAGAFVKLIRTGGELPNPRHHVSDLRVGQLVAPRRHEVLDAPIPGDPEPVRGTALGNPFRIGQAGRGQILFDHDGSVPGTGRPVARSTVLEKGGLPGRGPASAGHKVLGLDRDGRPSQPQQHG